MKTERYIETRGEIIYAFMETENDNTVYNFLVLIIF
jgi:hypothetical protein